MKKNLDFFALATKTSVETSNIVGDTACSTIQDLPNLELKFPGPVLDLRPLEGSAQFLFVAKQARRESFESMASQR